MTTNLVLLKDVRSIIEDRMENTNKIKLNQISNDISSSFSHASQVIEYLSNNKQLISSIQEIETDIGASEKNLLYNNIVSILMNFSGYSPLIGRIEIYTKNNYFGIVQTKTDVALHEFYDSLSDSNSEIGYEVQEERTSIIVLDGITYIARSLYNDYSLSGVIFLQINGEYFRKADLEGERILIVDQNSNIMWQGQEFNNIDKTEFLNNSKTNLVFEENKIKIYKSDMKYQKWTMYYLFNLEQFISTVDLARSSSLIISLIAFITAFIFSEFISYTITKPMVSMINFSRKYEVNDVYALQQERLKIKNRTGLREKIFYYLIITLLIPICTYAILFYYQSKNIITSKVTESYGTVFENAINRIDDDISRKVTTMNRLGFDKEIQQLILDPNANNDKPLIEDIVVRNSILGIGKAYTSIINTNNTPLFSNSITIESMIDEEFFKTLLKDIKPVMWYSSIDKQGRNNINLITPVYNMTAQKFSIPIGFIKAEIDQLMIYEKYMDIKTDFSEVMIRDQYENIIIPGNIPVVKGVDIFNKESGTKYEAANLDGVRYIIYSASLKSIPWEIICSYELSGQMEQSNKILFSNTLSVIFIAFIMVLILTYFLAAIISRPIYLFNSVVENVSLDNLNKRVNTSYFIDEFSIMGKAFNEMIDRIENLVDEIIEANHKRLELETQKKTAEIIALQSQINPHFLYNTLDTINYMVKDGQGDKAVMMINSLSDLFRYGLSRGELLITIMEELEYAKAYADIMTLRYNNNIRFNWSIDDTLLEFKTIKLIIQPMIENSIYHGIGTRKSQGVIEIMCVDGGNCIKFIIKDNGAGMTEDRLTEINDILKSGSLKKMHGIFNVQSRIFIYYGKEFGLEMQSKLGEGTIATICIPKIKKGRELLG